MQNQSEQQETQSQEATPKKAYRKPEVKRFNLRPEEAVLGGCKIAGTGGPGPGTCTDSGGCNAITS
jgi:hypothetical protein